MAGESPEPRHPFLLGFGLLLGHHWQLLFFLGIVAAVLWTDELAGVLAKAIGAGRERQRRELETAPAREALPVPAPCAHRGAEPVYSLVDGDLVAWLCPDPGCGEQLPAGFSGSEPVR